MANRKIRETSIGYRKRSANEVIRDMLMIDDGKRSGEILEHLKSEGIKYTKRGLYKRLNTMIDAGMIEKRQPKGALYPTYHRIIKSDDHSSLGFWLRYFMDDYTFFEDVMRKLHSRQQLRLWCTLIGVYTIFVEMQSWKLASDKKSHRKFNANSSFLRNALPFVTPYSRSGLEEAGKNTFSRKFANERNRKALLELEGELAKMFPKEMRLVMYAFNRSKTVSAVKRL